MATRLHVLAPRAKGAVMLALFQVRDLSTLPFIDFIGYRQTIRL